MLRVRRSLAPKRPRFALLSGFLNRAEPTELAPAVAIVQEFNDPLLELVRLLREAANVEHALLVQYLFATFSIRPKYDVLVGSGLQGDDLDFLGVAIQEMQHFNAVNHMLVSLGAAPHLGRDDFPIVSDLYPFPLELERLTRKSTAKYVAAESPVDALDPNLPANGSDRVFINAVHAELGTTHVNHIGSLYGTVITVAERLLAATTPGFPDLRDLIDRLNFIRRQGEKNHYLFFRSVFLGTHPAFAGMEEPWADLNSATYPSMPMASNPTAIEGDPRAINDPNIRRICWLGDLLYWLVLALLDRDYRGGDGVATARAIAHMTSNLLPLGKSLASRGFGLPFDSLGLHIGSGNSNDAGAKFLKSLALEVKAVVVDLSAAIPADFLANELDDTITSLNL
jgi:Ferritin-like